MRTERRKHLRASNKFSKATVSIPTVRRNRSRWSMRILHYMSGSFRMFDLQKSFVRVLRLPRARAYPRSRCYMH
jgi:hypothetical protein